MITRLEIKELLSVLRYYVISGLALGIAVATIAVNGGIPIARSDYGLPIPVKAVSAIIVIMIGVMTSLLAYLVLLPAELRVVRRKLRPIILAKRLSGRK